MEYIMVSASSFEQLEFSSKAVLEVDQQQYEDVAGFESLSSEIQTRTTAYSCSYDDEEDYDQDSLASRPLPWVVRVYFEVENSMKGEICSGKL